MYVCMRVFPESSSKLWYMNLLNFDLWWIRILNSDVIFLRMDRKKEEVLLLFLLLWGMISILQQQGLIDEFKFNWQQ